MAFLSTLRRHWLPLLLTLFALGVRLVGIGSQSLWFDETVSALVARMPWRDGVAFVLADGVHPPLYYALQKVSLFLGTSEAAWRFPAVLFGTLAVPVLYRIVLRWTERATAATAAACLALSPLHVWYSREARMYSLLVLLTLAGMALYAGLVFDSGRSPRRNLAFVGVHALAYLTHYFAAVLFLIQLAHLTLHLRRHAPTLRRWAGLQAIAFLPLLGWGVLLAGRSGSYFGIGWIPTPEWRDPFLTGINFAAGYSPPLTILHVLAAGLVLGLALAGLTSRRRDPSLRSVLGLWAFLPVGLGLAFSLARPLYIDRFFLGSLPALLLLASFGLSRLTPRLRGSFTTGVLLLSVWGVYRLNFAPHQLKEQWREAGRYLSQATVEDVVVPRVLQIVVPLTLYYRGEAPLRALEANRERQSLGELAWGRREVWLVYWNAAGDAHTVAPQIEFDPMSETDPETVTWLSAEGPQLIERRDFVGVTIFRFAGPADG